MAHPALNFSSLSANPHEYPASYSGPPALRNIRAASAMICAGVIWSTGGRLAGLGVMGPATRLGRHQIFAPIFRLQRRQVGKRPALFVCGSLPALLCLTIDLFHQVFWVAPPNTENHVSTVSGPIAFVRSVKVVDGNRAETVPRDFGYSHQAAILLPPHLARFWKFSISLRGGVFHVIKRYHHQPPVL